MHRRVEIIISLLLLAYGLLRLGVGSGLLGQALGFFTLEAFEEPLADVGAFLGKKQEQQLVPTSVAGYVGYIALMGLTLSIGAIGTLARKPLGLAFVGAFLLMYAALFINFQTINPKIVHLAVCTVLFLGLVWARKRPSGS